MDRSRDEKRRRIAAGDYGNGPSFSSKILYFIVGGLIFILGFYLWARNLEPIPTSSSAFVHGLRAL